MNDHQTAGNKKSNFHFLLSLASIFVGDGAIFVVTLVALTPRDKRH